MKKLKTRPQMLLYAISGMGVNLLNLMMGSYLCSALLTGGFKDEAVKFQTFTGSDLVVPAVWSIFALAAKILDGVIDVPMASFTDRLRSRWGRRRPALLIGLIPMVLAYVLFLIVPQKGATLLNTVYYGVILCIFYSFYTLTMVTYYATFTEIVETERERNFISNVKSVCDILYFIIGYVLVRMLLNGMNIRPVALIVLPMVVTMLIPLFMIQEGSSLDGKVGGKDTVGLFKSLRYTFRNRTFILWMVCYAFMTFGVQLFLGGINEYFSYVGMSMILVMATAFAPVPLTLLLYNRLQKKHGFVFAFRYILLVYTVGMIAMFATGRLADGSTAKMACSIVCGLIASLAIGAMFSVAYSVPSQLAADEEKVTGVSHSAMYFAVQGLFAGVATGIATGIVLTALKANSGQGTVNGPVSYMTLICAAGTLVSFALTFLLPRSLKELGKESKT